jgi:outer membrane murein-binding lipoprotein Lpp
MEARIARLESDVTHLLTDVSDIKADVRGLRDRIDAVANQLNGKIDNVASQLNAKFDGLRDSFAAAKIWAVYRAGRHQPRHVGPRPRLDLARRGGVPQEKGGELSRVAISVPR